MREPVPPDILVGRVMDALEGIRDEASLTWIVTDSGGIVLEASADALKRWASRRRICADVDCWPFSMASALSGQPGWFGRRRAKR